MGRQVTFTDLEWEYAQQKFHESLQNFPNTFEQGEQDDLGANILARMAAATAVAEPDPVAIAVPGGIQSEGDRAGGGYQENNFGAGLPIIPL
jgi:hypothetical protein